MFRPVTLAPIAEWWSPNVMGFHRILRYREPSRWLASFLRIRTHSILPNPALNFIMVRSEHWSVVV